MRMPWSSHLCCVLFLAAIGQILTATEMQDKTVSYSHNRSRLYDFSKKEFKCLWRYEVHDSDLRNKVNTAFTEGNKLISLTIKFSYPKKVDEKCLSQTSNNSIGGNTKQWNYSFWQIFLIDRKLPISVNNAIRRFSSWIGAHVDVSYVKVNCSLQFTAKSANRQHLSGELSSRGYLERIPMPFLIPALFIEYLLYQNVLSPRISVKERTHGGWCVMLVIVFKLSTSTSS